jgi:hypothetical protein
MKRTGTVLAFSLAALLPLAASAQATYEPQRRLRTPLDTCMQTEVMQEAWCVRKCQSNFRMEMQGGKARCIATKADAKFVPPEPEFKPPASPQNIPKVPGA